MRIKTSSLFFAVSFVGICWAMAAQVLFAIAWLWWFVAVFALWAIFFAIKEWQV